MVTNQNYAALESERIALGEKILAKNYAPLAQEFLKKGCPKCLRSRIWTLLLGAEVKSSVSSGLMFYFVIISFFSKLPTLKT